MPQNNRNGMRDRKDEPSRRYKEEGSRRYSSHSQPERSRDMDRVNFERTDQRTTERENDLYERQSM